MFLIVVCVFLPYRKILGAIVRSGVWFMCNGPVRYGYFVFGSQLITSSVLHMHLRRVSAITAALACLREAKVYLSV